MRHYETIGGQVTRGETLSKLLALLKEAEDCCYVMSHLHETEGNTHDQLLAKGWRSIGYMLDMMHKQVIELAKGKLQ